MDTSIKLSIRQIQEMKHALGGTLKKSYRNYFNTGTDCKSWEELVNLGLATKKTGSKEMGGVYYYVSPEGIEALKRLDM